MSKHTPGPWELDPTEQRGIDGSRIYKVCGSGLIADVSCWWYDTETAAANARLIAAAPTLLEAAKAALQAIDPEIRPGLTTKPLHLEPYFRPVAKQLRDAIRKAEASD